MTLAAVYELVASLNARVAVGGPVRALRQLHERDPGEQGADAGEPLRRDRAPRQAQEPEAVDEHRGDLLAPDGQRDRRRGADLAGSG